MKIMLIDEPLLKSVLTLATLIEARDSYTGGHTWRVSQYAVKLAQALNLSHDEVFLIALGGMIHDLGKIAIPDAILNKPDKLTDEEFMKMRQHPVVGVSSMSDHPLADLVRPMIEEHHERHDGTGYPHGKRGEDTHLYARIVAIADAFDAMTSSRPYRKGMGMEKALSILDAGTGTQFDPELTPIFTGLGHKGTLDHILGHSAEGRLMVDCPACGPTLALSRNDRDGDVVCCPNCTGKYRIHRRGDHYEAEFTGILDPGMTPKPDLEQVQDFLKDVPKAVWIPG
ncbi:HD-GYP domain-containing protein [Deinococcus cellulosilyticus]|uniref:Uncharacterized protein n=1 Tax=Deinococcus cellulosilyticus (strain DSM 18568 / NBRC 106333 / KACC 11606 / 5516J-15) TaxID=1223518 RepID=A0A511MZL3_DEIC1|nr:HD-GYP domain-containing protein [Deinococcus cellulosilyticus]GEM46060.1 hypothetical protein DC3_16950 [Deinococcus cellulosilyticus NBRC 106333 = KACC 11606]